MKNLGDLERLVRPAATRLDFLDDKDWRTARELLSRTINAARAATDPDQALPSSEWGRLVDRDAADDLDLAELLALTRGEDWREDSADPRDTSLVDTGPLVLDYKTKRAKTARSSKQGVWGSSTRRAAGWSYRERQCTWLQVQTQA